MRSWPRHDGRLSDIDNAGHNLEEAPSRGPVAIGCLLGKRLMHSLLVPIGILESFQCVTDELIHAAREVMSKLHIDPWSLTSSLDLKAILMVGRSSAKLSRLMVEATFTLTAACIMLLSNKLISS
jgi:hypothetical protein